MRCVSSRLLLGLCVAASFSGCAFWVSPDETRVEVRSIPEEVFQTEIVADDHVGLAQLSYAYAAVVSPFGASWGQFETTSLERLPAGPHTTRDYLRWREADRYGVLTLDRHRCWRIWWFEPGEVVRERSPETHDIETRVFDLQGRTASAPIPDETLRHLGIGFGLRKPSFRDAHKSNVGRGGDPVSRRLRWTDEIKRDLKSLKADLSEPVAAAWRLDDGSWHLVDDAAFAAEEPDLWSDDDRKALESMFDAFYELDDAFTRHDAAAQNAAILRFESAVTALSR